MATINVNFELRHTPNPIGVGLALQLNGTKLSISPVEIPYVSVIAIPRYSGSIVDSVITTIVTPLVNIVTGSLSMFASNIFSGKSFDVLDVPNISFDVPGGSVTLKPTNLSVSEFGGMMMISGDIAIQ